MRTIIRGELVASLREREKLWPDRAEGLRDVANDYRKLAYAVAQGRKPLAPAEETEKPFGARNRFPHPVASPDGGRFLGSLGCLLFQL
jgi:hypothetical protein